MNNRYRNRILGMHFRQLDHAARQMAARDNKTKSILTRMHWLERQKNANYKNEHDRIRNHLATTQLGDHSKKRLEDRAEELHVLFSRGNVST